MENNEFPRWMYGPKGEAQIFSSEEDVPKGWSAFQKKEGENEEVADPTMDESVHDVGLIHEDATSPVEPSEEPIKKSKKRSAKKK